MSVVITDKGREYLDTMQQRSLESKAPASDREDIVVLYILESEGDKESTDYLMAGIALFEKKTGSGISKSRVDGYFNSIRRLFEAGYIDQY